MYFAMLAVIVALKGPDELDRRLAQISGVYTSVFRAPASPGCGIPNPIIATLEQADGSAKRPNSAFRVKASRTEYLMTFRSGHGSVFEFSGTPSLRGDRLFVHGTYKSMDEADMSRVGAIGSGTFDFVVDAHDNAMISVESFTAKADPNCFVIGAKRVGIRIAPFDGRKW